MNFIFSYCRDSEHYANTTMGDEEGYDVPGDIPVGIYLKKLNKAGVWQTSRCLPVLILLYCGSGNLLFT